MRKHTLYGILSIASLAFNMSHTKNANDYIIQFFDSDNYLLQFKHKPKRIAAFANASSVVYYAVDKSLKSVFSINPYDKNKLSFYALGNKAFEKEYINKDFKSMHGGHMANVEDVLMNKIDLVINWYWFNKPLRAVKIQALSWKCCDPNDINHAVRTLGYITGKVQNVQKIFNMHENTRTELSKKSPKGAKPTIFVIGSMRGNKISYQSKFDHYIKMAHANVVRNMKAAKIAHGSSINSEMLLSLDPDIIFVSNYGKIKPDDLYKSDVMQNLKAVKNKRIYKMPIFTSSSMLPERFLTADWFYTIAHPSRAQYAEFNKKIKKTYKELYNTVINKTSLDIMLHTKINNQSLSYRG